MSVTTAGITKRFGRFTALDEVSVHADTGSLTALLGPSGSGKSTLLRIIAGLDTAESGRVVIGGSDVTALPPQRREVGFVFQHYAPFRHLTVADNVAFGLTVRRRRKPEIRARVEELLELMHLQELADRYPAQLSGGQRQRMALARALAVPPRVLLLDEPFGALDAQVRGELRGWLRRLHEQLRITTVIVTHDQEEAMELADELVVMTDGRVVQVGPPREVYEQPRDEWVMGFLGPVTRWRDTLVRPHDLVLEAVDPVDTGDPAATVVELVRLGFATRVRLEQAGSPLWAQLTTHQVDRLGLRVGDPVRVSHRGAALPVGR